MQLLPTGLAGIGGGSAMARESSVPVEAWLQICFGTALTLKGLSPREFLGVGYDAGITLSIGASTDMS